MRRSGWFVLLLVAATAAAPISSAAARTTDLEQLESRFRSSVAENHAAAGATACGSEALPLWQRVENFFGGRRINANVSFGKEAFGVSGGRVIENHWINVQVEAGFLVHLPLTSIKDLAWERCRAS